MNIIGKAAQNGKQLFVVGKCKTQLKKRDVDGFLKNLNIIKVTLNQELLPILVTYQASPQVQNYVQQKGIKLYFSYQFPVQKVKKHSFPKPALMYVGQVSHLAEQNRPLK